MDTFSFSPSVIKQWFRASRLSKHSSTDFIQQLEEGTQGLHRIWTIYSHWGRPGRLGLGPPTHRKTGGSEAISIWNPGLDIPINPDCSIAASGEARIYHTFGISVCIHNIPLGYTAFVGFGVSTLNSTKMHMDLTPGAVCGQAKYTNGVAWGVGKLFVCMPACFPCEISKHLFVIRH